MFKIAPLRVMSRGSQPCGDAPLSELKINSKGIIQMEWLENILETLRNIFPRTFTIFPDEAGVRITFGTRVKSLGPGWYVFWPPIQHVEKLSVMPQAVDLRPQSVHTSDGVDMVISGAILYRISDAKKAILNV